MKGARSLVREAGSPLFGAVRAFGFFLFLLIASSVNYVARPFVKDPFPLIRFFYKILNWILGVTVVVRGTPCRETPVLFVSNHTSYLDVPILGSVLKAAFVAKSEVARWPIIGAMAAVQQTVFVERRPIRAAEQSDGMRQRLEKGQSIVLFPEGTSTDGQRVLPFKSSLFSIVEEPLADGRPVWVQGVTVLPTKLDGLPLGRAWRPYYAWFGDMGFFKHLWLFFCLGGFTVEIIFHTPVTARDFSDRKALAGFCHDAVAAGAEQALTGRFSS